MLLSIIIPAFNETELIAQTLDRIQYALNENFDEAFSRKITICDNNSTE